METNTLTCPAFFGSDLESRAKASVDVSHIIKKKATLLDGICPQATNRIQQDKNWARGKR